MESYSSIIPSFYNICFRRRSLLCHRFYYFECPPLVPLKSRTVLRVRSTPGYSAPNALPNLVDNSEFSKVAIREDWMGDRIGRKSFNSKWDRFLECLLEIIKSFWRRAVSIGAEKNLRCLNRDFSDNVNGV